MSHKEHVFLKNVCKDCGLSKDAVNYFKWECKAPQMAVCKFCGKKNRINKTDSQEIRLVCGSCKKPLFVRSESAYKSPLETLVGLNDVKRALQRIVAFVRVSLRRSEAGFSTAPLTVHCVFQGSPGTGKTEVARLLAVGLKEAGYLSGGQLVEVDRASLIGAYMGHTEERVLAKCKEAIGGVLFIDEAYALVSDARDAFGKAAIDTLLKFMEDHRREVVVIVAGYPDQMDTFLQANPGLRSRFTHFLVFPDYSPKELCEIFKRILYKSSYFVRPDIKDAQLVALFEKLTLSDQHFGNARGVRNIAEKLFAIHAERLISCEDLTTHNIAEIGPEDFETLCKELGIPVDAHSRTGHAVKQQLAPKKRKDQPAKSMRKHSIVRNRAGSK
jgi:stage V sporulation protein K